MWAVVMGSPVVWTEWGRHGAWLWEWEQSSWLKIGWREEGRTVREEAERAEEEAMTLGPPLAPAHSLADEGSLGDGVQGADPPAHFGCSVELQSNPGGGREGDARCMGDSGCACARAHAGPGPHLMPLCTTRFLQFLQQEQAWLHSKISGGSILLNSWSSRPSWGG